MYCVIVKLNFSQRLAPRLEKQQHRVDEHHTSDKETPSSKRLHQEYAMIKYPRKRWSIPSEKIFKIDKDNLVSLVEVAVGYSSISGSHRP